MVGLIALDVGQRLELGLRFLEQAAQARIVVQLRLQVAVGGR